MTCESCFDVIPQPRAVIIEAWKLPHLCLDCRLVVDARQAPVSVDDCDPAEARAALVEIGVAR